MDFDLDAATAVLTRTPDVLRALLDGLPDAWVHATEGGETWSPYTVVGHLALAERTNWIPRARAILAQGPERRFVPFERVPRYEGEPPALAHLLDDFARRRAESLATLAGWRIGARELALEGEHPEFGRVTLAQLLATWTAHDLAHLTQITRTMARGYADAVGPWAAYLSVLRR